MRIVERMGVLDVKVRYLKLGRVRAKRLLHWFKQWSGRLPRPGCFVRLDEGIELCNYADRYSVTECPMPLGREQYRNTWQTLEGIQAMLLAQERVERRHKKLNPEELAP